MNRILGLTVAFLILTAIFWAVELLWPSISAQRKLRRGFGLDVLYWFFTPLISKTVSQVAVLLALAPIFLLLGWRLEKEAIAAGFGPLLQLPLWLQAILILVVGDFIGYWSHRWFHSRRLWKFHAIHHSSTELDWLSSVRLHPVNEVGSRILQAIPFVLLGFSPKAVAAYVPFLTFYAILIHANVSWGFGPLRYVIATPLFHRWHHTSEDEALDKNFAGLLPLWDVLFGTLYLPEGKRPTHFGTHDHSVPESFLGQLAYPFRKTGGAAVAEAPPPMAPVK
jgi:sterol desaturase/sphingolipid hydroxylase (fatty acid hydroxylase superfamily)